MIKEPIHEMFKIHDNLNFFIRYGQPIYLPRNDMDNSSVATS